MSDSMNCDQCQQFCPSCMDDGGACGKSSDVDSLHRLLFYGLKGVAAYNYHLRRLGFENADADAFISEALFSTMTNVSFDYKAALDMVIRCGSVAVDVMASLDSAHNSLFGNSFPAEVSVGLIPGKHPLLVTGHDLVDLANILSVTDNFDDIAVYTHGELLPAHSYTALRCSSSLCGHYGGPWQKQRMEFEAFPGPVVATTNCVVQPSPANSYLDRLFVFPPCSIPGARVLGSDLSPLIDKALSSPVVSEASPLSKLFTGFGWRFLDSHLLDPVVSLVKAGRIKNVFVIGGCDGANPSRNYFRDFAVNLPKSSLILTLGCGKYRINDYNFGDIDGIPRLWDLGQCNDTFSAIRFATLLSDKLGCSIFDLPLTLCLSWYEQKAIAVLLGLLSLGIKGIKIGPTLPEFLSPRVVSDLSEAFGLTLVGSEGSSGFDDAAVYYG